MNGKKIRNEIYELYDEYCHTQMDRRDFLSKAALLGLMGGFAGKEMASWLLPNYANAQEVMFTDKRILARNITIDSPGGNSGKMSGYLVQPVGKGPFPSVLIVHENRGLNPYIRDVARRAATAGFLAFAPDALSVIGGYPGNDDEGKKMQASLDQDKIIIDMKNSAYFLKKHELSNGKLGVTGFCFGGKVSNQLAVEMGGDLQVSVPFYGRSPDMKDVSKIKANMLIHYAQTDPNVNATREEYAAELKKNGINYEIFTYPETNHGFHNYSTPRYNEVAAKLAWERTISIFNRFLK